MLPGERAPARKALQKMQGFFFASGFVQAQGLPAAAAAP